MSAANLDRTYLPSSAGDHEGDVSMRFDQIVKEIKLSEPGAPERPRLVYGDESVEIPDDISKILIQITTAMSQGKAISIVPREQMLSTQEAADMLGISRPTFVKLLEDGKIPFQKTNRHRRVYLVDVLEYQKRQRREAREKLDDMVSDSEMFGDYDVNPEELSEVLAEVRGKQ